MHVQVAGTELREALSIWRGMKASRFPAEAQVYRDGESLVIDSGGNAIAIGVTGQWEGVARVSMYFLLGLSRKPPTGASVEIRVADGKFHIGTTSIGCEAQFDHEDGIGTTLDASLADILAMAFTHDEMQIKAAGLERAVANANRKATKLINKAMVHLARLGVNRDQVFSFVQQTLSEKGNLPVK